MQILRHADRRPVPWKNGMGITYEVARRDDDDCVLWRVSIAVCERPCPFSRFDGLDRQLLVIDGGPMRLVIDGTPVTVEPGSPPIAFPGEAQVDCKPLGTPTFDLNLMTRRGTVTGSIALPGSAATGASLLVIVGESATIAGLTLTKLDALIIDDGEVGTVPLEAAHNIASIHVTGEPLMREVR